MGPAKVKLHVVTNNAKKGEEAVKILESLGVEAELVLLEKKEIQSEKLEEIALHSARTAYLTLRKPLVVDDSGLFIEDLNGFPGPYSSYVYKTIGVKGILKLMEGAPTRKACFKTALAVIIPPIEKVYVGETCGTITTEPRGTGGFGFDPIFVPEGEIRTYAEMSTEEKNKVSHRAKAYKLMVEDLRKTWRGIL
ncbi:MAG: XTP/dITP diphosphatase [Thermoprotei archaeon]|nr:XTP/dITP diphosphatase [Thermoprotei archaeon]